LTLGESGATVQASYGSRMPELKILQATFVVAFESPLMKVRQSAFRAALASILHGQPQLGFSPPEEGQPLSSRALQAISLRDQIAIELAPTTLALTDHSGELKAARPIFALPGRILEASESPKAKNYAFGIEVEWIVPGTKAGEAIARAFLTERDPLRRLRGLYGASLSLRAKVDPSVDRSVQIEARFRVDSSDRYWAKIDDSRSGAEIPKSDALYAQARSSYDELERLLKEAKVF